MTIIWVSGLLIIFTLGVLCLGSLALAIFKISRAHGADEVAGYVVIFALVLVALGAVLKWFVNRFYDWWLVQRLNSLSKEISGAADHQPQFSLEKYETEFSARLPEPFRQQLRSSPTFQATVIEAKNLAEEAAAFASVSHTDEEKDAFRKAWQAKLENFTERMAKSDPLAVEVILKAIDMESEKMRKR